MRGKGYSATACPVKRHHAEFFSTALTPRPGGGGTGVKTFIRCLNLGHSSV
ncbi:hypothetical protein [Azospirillum argentinense]